MIGMVADRIWKRDAFQSEVRKLLRQNLRDYLRIEGPQEEIDEEVLTRLLQSATYLASVKDSKQKEAAYRIGSSAWSLFRNRFGNSLRQPLQVVFGRLGNFPAIQLLFREIAQAGAISEEYSPGQGLGISLQLEVNSRAYGNEVEVASEVVLTLTDFQKRLWDTLETGTSVSVTAPTSAGKSFALQHFIARSYANRKGFIGLYVVPTRSLIHQVAEGLRRIALSLTGKSPQIITIPDASTVAGQSVLYVLTQERLQILLESNSDLVFSVVVIDEAQMLGDGSRGIILQTTIDEIRRRAPETQLLFSSPPISNSAMFSEVFEISDSAPIDERESPVAQNLIFLDVDDALHDIVHVKAMVLDDREYLGDVSINAPMVSPKQTLATLSWFFGRDDQSLVYVGSQAASEDVANMISDLNSEAAEGFSNEVRAELKDLSNFFRDHVHPQFMLTETVKNGVGFHYGQMPSIVRQAVEDYFDEGLLRTLVSTSTLLHGVNLPAKNLFILDPTKGGEWPNRNATPVSGPEFWNLAGRAGRLGKEFEGNVFVINHDKWRSKTLDEPREQAVENSLDIQVVDKTAKLLEFVADIDHASGKVQELESCFNRLFNEYREGTLDKTLTRIYRNDLKTIQMLRDAISNAASLVHVPSEVTRKHITVSVYRQEQMLNHLRTGIRLYGPVGYLPPHPQAEWKTACPPLVKVFNRIHTEFERVSNNSSAYFGPLALIWMKGSPLPKMISRSYEHQSKGKRKPPKISSVIRKVMSEIEKELRFRYVKFTACYIDLLKIALADNGHEQYVDKIVSLPLYLELGASSKTMISLIGLGLSRITAGILAEKAANIGMDIDQAKDWLARFNVEVASIPGACVREIEKLRAKM